MAASSLNLRQEQNAGVNAAFMSNHRGDVCIAFSDPAYARADTILIDKKKMAISAILHGHAFYIGTASDAMLNQFEKNGQALLTAILADGSLLETNVPVETSTN